jgi:hypothetical protein
MEKKLKAGITPLYEDLKKVNSQKVINPSEFNKLGVFCAQVGKFFPQTPNTGILFVGRATNSFEEGWDNYGYGNYVSSMEDTIRAFFRVIKKVALEKVVEEFGDAATEKWYEYVTWSNLYKLAPKEGGNPSGTLRNAQIEVCCKILAKEVEILSPKFVVMFTANWEDKFLSSLNDDQYPKDVDKAKWGNYTTKVYQIKGVTYIVSYHPGRKPEKPHADAIKRLMKKFI